MLHGKEELRLQMELMESSNNLTLKWGDYPDLSVWANVSTRDLMRVRLKDHRRR